MWPNLIQSSCAVLKKAKSPFMKYACIYMELIWYSVVILINVPLEQLLAIVSPRSSGLQAFSLYDCASPLPCRDVSNLYLPFTFIIRRGNTINKEKTPHPECIALIKMATSRAWYLCWDAIIVPVCHEKWVMINSRIVAEKNLGVVCRHNWFTWWMVDSSIINGDDIKRHRVLDITALSHPR